MECRCCTARSELAWSANDALEELIIELAPWDNTVRRVELVKGDVDGGSYINDDAREEEDSRLRGSVCSTCKDVGLCETTA